KYSRVESRIVHSGVERTVVDGRADVLHDRHDVREHVDRSAIVGGTDRRGRSGTAIEQSRADKLCGEEGPRMVSRTVRVVKRNTVERHGVITICETAKERLAVTETDAVGTETERARRHLHHLSVVGGGRSE